jgi:hypothetical protein
MSTGRRSTAIAIVAGFFVALTGFGTVGTANADPVPAADIKITAGATPTCDNATHLCKTPIIELHQDSPGDSRLKNSYDAPPGVQFVGRQRGVELEAGGADHHVHAYSDGPNQFSCEWYAKKRVGGDNGLAKGYCEAEFTGTAG